MNPKCIYWKQKDKDEYNLSDEILGQELDDDFFIFDIYGRHANYLANPNRIIIRFKRNVNNNNISIWNNRNRYNLTWGSFRYK